MANTKESNDITAPANSTTPAVPHDVHLDDCDGIIDVPVVTAESHLRNGDIYCIDENYDLAIDFYAMAEISATDSLTKFRLYSHRSAAFYNLRRYQDAYDDAVIATTLLSTTLTDAQQKAVKKAQESTATNSTSSSSSVLLRGETEACWRRYGMSAYELHFYTEALTGFQNAYQLSKLNGTMIGKTTTSYYEEWIQKCQHRNVVEKTENNEQHPSIEDVTTTSNSKNVVSSAANKIDHNPGLTVDVMENAIGIKTLPTPKAPSLADAIAKSNSCNNASTSIARPSPSYAVPKYQYYQSDKFMTIVILESHLNDQRLCVQLGEKSLSVTIAPPSNTNINSIASSASLATTTAAIICGTLYDEIDVNQSKTVYKTEKALIKLRKRKAFEWHQLLSKDTTFSRNEALRKKAKQHKQQIKGNDGDDSDITPPPPSKDNSSTDGKFSSLLSERALSPLVVTDAESSADAGADATASKSSSSATTATVSAATTATLTTTTMKKTPAIPRPYSSHRDWDSIERDLEIEEASEQPVGDEAMNKLFQQLFKDADPDARRAMIKSYQTSGGTVLSTNWDEVKSTDYEAQRTAPKGMEWKTWEGEKLPLTDD